MCILYTDLSLLWNIQKMLSPSFVAVNCLQYRCWRMGKTYRLNRIVIRKSLTTDLVPFPQKCFWMLFTSQEGNRGSKSMWAGFSHAHSSLHRHVIVRIQAPFYKQVIFWGEDLFENLVFSIYFHLIDWNVFFNGK